MFDRDERNRLVQRVVLGATSGDSDLVSKTLTEFENEASNRAHLEGFIAGIAFGAIVGAALVGLISAWTP